MWADLSDLEEEYGTRYLYEDIFRGKYTLTLDKVMICLMN